MAWPPVAFADEEALAAWLLGGDYEAQTPEGEAADRILARASERINCASSGAYEVDELTELPETVVLVALEQATCAQVEQWLEVGEENDISGYPGDTYMSAGVSVNRQPSKLAPRAAMILSRLGLLNAAGLEAAGETTVLPPIGVDIV